MGTHPIFESDFDCLTECLEMGDVEQLRIDLEKLCSTEETVENKYQNIPDSLQEILKSIAQNGQLPFELEWKQVSHVVRRRLLYCIDQMNTQSNYTGSSEEYDSSCDLLLERIRLFHEAPFTLQRICELVIEPSKYYKNTNKYIHALLRCLLVVSGWRKPAQSDLPKEDQVAPIESKQHVEPDSTTKDSPTKITDDAYVQMSDKSQADGPPQPDSTTNEQETTISSTTEKPEPEITTDCKDEPVFHERPKSNASNDDDEAGVFGEKATNSPKRKVHIIPKSNIKINVGSGKAAILGQDELKSDSTPSHLDGEKIESEDDEEKRKRKRSLDENEVETELKESPQTPQKLQKTE